MAPDSRMLGGAGVKGGGCLCCRASCQTPLSIMLLLPTTPAVSITPHLKHTHTHTHADIRISHDLHPCTTWLHTNGTFCPPSCRVSRAMTLMHLQLAGWRRKFLILWGILCGT